MNIMPVSDLRNKFPEVEKVLNESGSVYLTKNGYGVAVLMDMNEYMSITNRPLNRQVREEKNSKSLRGSLHKYANPDLIPLEKDAARIHVLKKYGKLEG